MTAVTRRTAAAPAIVAAAILAGCSWPRLVVPHDPLTPAEHVALGEAYRAKGLEHDAEKEFQAALARHADYVPALISAGNLAFQRGDWAAARKAYERVLAQDPTNVQASNNLAMVHVSRGERLEEAERLARTALKDAGPWRPFVLETLAQVALRQGRPQEALACVDEAEGLLPPEQTPLRARFSELRREVTGVPSKH